MKLNYLSILRTLKKFIGDSVNCVGNKLRGTTPRILVEGRSRRAIAVGREFMACTECNRVVNFPISKRYMRLAEQKMNIEVTQGLGYLLCERLPRAIGVTLISQRVLRLGFLSTWIALTSLLSACAPRVTHVVLNQEPTQEVLFQVVGTSLKEVGAGVHGHLHGGYAGFANWNTQYASDVHEPVFGKCTARKININFQSKITLPDWRSSGSFEANVLPRWNKFIAALRVHEEGHVQIALAEARTLVAELEAMTPLQADTCSQLEDKIRQKFDLAVKTGSDASERYDLLTKHGALQGAVADWYD